MSEEKEFQFMNEETTQPESFINMDESPSAESRIVELEQNLLDAAAALADTKKLLEETQLRARADAENRIRKAKIDSDSLRKKELTRIIEGFIPAVDALEKGIETSDKQNETLKPVIDGMELTLKLLIDALEKSSVTIINPEGEIFDPTLHQAMSMVRLEDRPDNIVITVFQKGYKLEDRALRPAMVVVNKLT